jgi:hypothetical protein
MTRKCVMRLNPPVAVSSTHFLSCSICRVRRRRVRRDLPLLRGTSDSGRDRRGPAVRGRRRQRQQQQCRPRELRGNAQVHDPAAVPRRPGLSRLPQGPAPGDDFVREHHGGAHARRRQRPDDDRAGPEAAAAPNRRDPSPATQHEDPGAGAARGRLLLAGGRGARDGEAG